MTYVIYLDNPLAEKKKFLLTWFALFVTVIVG